MKFKVNKKSANRKRKHLSIKKLIFTLYSIMNLMSILSNGNNAVNIVIHLIITETLVYIFLKAISSIRFEELKILFQD